MTTINAFNDIEDKPIEDKTGKIAGNSSLDSVASLQIGSGDKSFKGDESGIWLGADKSADAPFRVDMQGRVTLRSTTGTGQITIDTINNVIIVNDGTYDRVLIGYSSGGF